MVGSVRKHLNPAMVVALLALFVALSGASYAAVQLPRNSVGAQQIKDNAVGSSEVRNRSLRSEDFLAGQLPRGAQGPGGAQGPRGPAGAQGLRGPSDLFWRRGDPSTLLAVSTAYYSVATITVPPGNYRVTGTLTVKADFTSSYSPPGGPGGRTEWMVDCHLWPYGSSPIADVYAGSELPRLANDRDFIPMSLDAAFDNSGAETDVTVRLRCAQSTNPGTSDLELSAVYPSLTAIRVADATETPN